MKVDIAIITIRPDEFKAVRSRFETEERQIPGGRTYLVGKVKTHDEQTYTIAIARCSDPGNDASQRLAHYIIHDLDPQLILVVGIAGGIPHDDFTLGDVVISTRIVNPNVDAWYADGTTGYITRGGPPHPLVEDITSLLPDKPQLAEWAASIQPKRPSLDPERVNIKGDDEWREKVRESLNWHFSEDENRGRSSTYITGPIISSNHLMKDPVRLGVIHKTNRDILAVEMEVAGVSEAAYGTPHYPVMAIRGISDIVGLQRDRRWTTYACQAAAAFTYAFIMTTPIKPRGGFAVDWEDLLSLGVDLVTLANTPPASDQDVRGYYEGNPLKWNILAAQGDVKRDITDTLIQSLTSSKNRVTMLCLSGEPGAGKSTLAWRVAVEVARSLERPLLHILNNKAKVWYELRRLAQQSQMPLVVLVDDVFRNRNVQRALEDLGPDQDIIIIATSRSNEIPENWRLPFLLPLQPLDEPTRTEKRRVLQKLGLDDNSLGGPRRKSLREANSWLIFMSEVSTGKEWKKIVGDSMDRLKEQDSDKVVYRAYQYLCYAGQYDLAVPETLIAALDDNGYFYNLPEHPMSKGLIFHDSRIQGNIKIQDRLRTRHPIFAREALKSYRRHPLAILKDFVGAVQPNQREHRIFLCVLLQSSLTLDREELESIIRSLLEQQKTAIDAILVASNSSELLHHWEVLYGDLGDHEKIKELKAIALTRPPQEAVDWLAHFKLIERGGTQEQIDKLISDANDWLAANPQDHDVRGAYLRLVEKKGDPEQIQAAIASTIEWLALPENRQDVEVRKTLLSPLKRKFNDSELIQAVIASTIEWLALPENRQDVEVRRAYLGLVEFKGDDRKQIESVINSTGAWLAANPQDRQVREAYLVLVRRKGTPEQATEAITATADWLDKNSKIDWIVSTPQDQNVRKAYLGLVEQKGTPAQITSVIGSTGIWLANNPQDVEVRKTYLGLVERKGNDREQIAAVITATTDWLTDNPQDHDVRRTYLGLVKRKGTEELIKAVIASTIEWLALPENRQDVEVRRAYLGLVEQQGEPEQITDVINSTGSWLADHPQDHEVLGTYLGLVEWQGDRKQLALACNLAKKWLDHNPMTRRRSNQYMWILKGYERVLSKLEHYQEKEQ